MLVTLNAVIPVVIAVTKPLICESPYFHAWKLEVGHGALITPLLILLSAWIFKTVQKPWFIL
jgi:hypothetical protein